MGFYVRWYKWGSFSLEERKNQEFVNSSMHINYDSPLEKTVASTILGSDDFIGLIAASDASRRFEALLKKDRTLRKQIELLGGQINT